MCTLLFSAENLAAVAVLKEATSTQQTSGMPRSLAQEDNSPLQNGEIHTNGVNESKTERNAATMPVLAGNRSKSRFPILLHTSIILCAYCFCKRCFI
jgi:peptidyl-prolyl isomerase G (cyclophilin G)